MILTRIGTRVDIEQPVMEALNMSRVSTLVAHGANEDHAGSGDDMCEAEQIRSGPEARNEDHDTVEMDQNMQQQR